MPQSAHALKRIFPGPESTPSAGSHDGAGTQAPHGRGADRPAAGRVLKSFVTRAHILLLRHAGRRPLGAGAVPPGVRARDCPRALVIWQVGARYGRGSRWGA